MLLPPTSGPTSVTSAYAVAPMNATSIAPPMPTIEGGRPLANVVTCPVLGSTREILPAAPSVTYSAPPGPMALPEAPARPVTSWAVAHNGVIIAINVAANNSSIPVIQLEHATSVELTLKQPGDRNTFFITHLLLFFGIQKSFINAMRNLHFSREPGARRIHLPDSEGRDQQHQQCNDSHAETLGLD